MSHEDVNILTCTLVRDGERVRKSHVTRLYIFATTCILFKMKPVQSLTSHVPLPSPYPQEHIIEPVRFALKYYSEMAQALEEEKKRTNERKDSLTNGSNTTVTKKNIEANSTTSSSSSSLSHNGKRPGSGKGAPNNPHASAVKDKMFVSKSPSPSSSATKSTTKTK